MSEKEKRKSNPRRRLLMRLIVGIGLFVALVSAGIVAFRPKGAQIVFIAPDDNGFEQIWIANLDNPENPRQLTFHEARITNFQVSQEKDIIFYFFSTRTEGRQFRVYNLNTGHSEQIELCMSIFCGSYILHPNGDLISYYEARLINELLSIDIYVYNIKTHERYLVYQTENSDDLDYRSEIQWIDNSKRLTFGEYPSTDGVESIFYDFDSGHTDTIALSGNREIGKFSSDGTYFVHYYYYIGRSYPDKWVMSVARTDNPTELLFSLPQRGETGLVAEYTFQDWHPNNEYILISERWSEQYYTHKIRSDLVLYHIETGMRYVLLSNPETMSAYRYASFNYDGSQILYQKYNNNTGGSQIMIYDVETAEENAFPMIANHPNPQWVNGGR